MASRPNDLGRYEHNADCPGDELGWDYVPTESDRATCRGCFSQGLIEQTRRSAYVAAADAFLQYLTDSFEELLAQAGATVTGQRCLLVIAPERLTPEARWDTLTTLHKAISTRLNLPPVLEAMALADELRSQDAGSNTRLRKLVVEEDRLEKHVASLVTKAETAGKNIRRALGLATRPRDERDAAKHPLQALALSVLEQGMVRVMPARGGEGLR